VSNCLWAVLAIFSGLGITVIGDMVSEEVRDRLDHIPHAILKLAAGRLDPGQRSFVYDDEWLPELDYILRGAEARPITRLITGTYYALGILITTHRIAPHLHRSAVGEPAPAEATALPPARAEAEWPSWDGYRRYLTDVKLMPVSAVQRLDEATDRVLGQLEVPSRDGMWRRYGLVATQVQSAKTDNYIGLACKAADAGYKLIVVLADNHNMVRKQIQIRMDEGFFGFDARHPERAGERSYLDSGSIPGARRPQVISLTTRDEHGDFRPWVACIARIPLGEFPVVLVIKKNMRILRHLRDWVANFGERPDPDGRSIARFPALVIDAEAGNASANVAAVNDDTTLPRINMAIRKLLESFEKCAYVGYTAASLASACLNTSAGPNKNGSGILPFHFIASLPAPSDYFGPERVFGFQPDDPCEGALEPLPIVRIVADYDDWMPDGHRKDWIPPSQLPGSLSQAISAFVLACAARQVRGQMTDHNSMLIHVTRFQNVQNHIADQISQHLQLLKDRVCYSHPGESAEMELRSMWEQDFIPSSAAFPDSGMPPVSWGQVWAQVQPAIEKIHVQAVNGTAAEALQYHEHRREGLSVIAVGGNKLPRELTLEGFTVSYYLQPSKIPSTLLQMDRWFDSRPGYEDLCRLYTTTTLMDACIETAVANDELRHDLEALEGDTLHHSDT
jgi:Z1 domain